MAAGKKGESHPDVNLEELEEVGVVGDGHLDHPVVHHRRQEAWLQDQDREEQPGEEDDRGRNERVDLYVVVWRQLELVIP